MATITVNNEALKVTQLANRKYAVYGAEAWARAQQRVSKLKSIGTTHKMIEGSYKYQTHPTCLL